MPNNNIKLIISIFIYPIKTTINASYLTFSDFTLFLAIFNTLLIDILSTLQTTLKSDKLTDKRFIKIVGTIQYLLYALKTV